MLALWKAGITHSCPNSPDLNSLAMDRESAELRGQADSIPTIPSLSKALVLVVKRQENLACFG